MTSSMKNERTSKRKEKKGQRERETKGKTSKKKRRAEHIGRYTTLVRRIVRRDHSVIQLLKFIEK